MATVFQTDRSPAKGAGTHGLADDVARVLGACRSSGTARQQASRPQEHLRHHISFGTRPNPPSNLSAQAWRSQSTGLGLSAPLGSRWRGWSNTPSGSCFSWKCIIAQHLEALPVVTLGSQPAVLGSQGVSTEVSSVQHLDGGWQPGAPCQLLCNKNLDAAEEGGAESGGSGKQPHPTPAKTWHDGRLIRRHGPRV